MFEHWLEKEWKAVDKHSGVMAEPVAEALKEFYRQEDKFSQAVVQGGTFAHCISGAPTKAGAPLILNKSSTFFGECFRAFSLAVISRWVHSNSASNGRSRPSRTAASGSSDYSSNT